MMINLNKAEAEWLRVVLNKVGGAGQTRYGLFRKLDKLNVAQFPSDYYNRTNGRGPKRVTGYINDEG